MLPFFVSFKTGSPVSEQVIYAVEKALISGQLKSGESFPSVRTLSQELRINPNTAHKIVGTLVSHGLLEVKPGIGTFIGKIPPATQKRQTELLENEVEKLVVEAKKSQLELNDVTRSLQHHWNKLTRPS